MPEADRSCGGESLADMVKRVEAMVWDWAEVLGGVRCQKRTCTMPFASGSWRRDDWDLGGGR
jgi:hypothetical protein